MFRTLQNKLLAWFLSFSIITIILIVPFSLYHYSKKEKVTQVIRDIDRINIALLKNIKLQNDFFQYETINPEYFRSSTSPYLIEINAVIKENHVKFEELVESIKRQKYGLEEDVRNIQSLYQSYTKSFDSIEKLIFERGFKDYGVEGQMRDYVHKLEDIKNLSQTKVLSLRRHEKDYIIRNDVAYIDKLNNLVQVFEKQIKNNNALTKADRDSSLKYLENYKHLFNKMVELDSKIGIKDNTGLKMELDQEFKLIESRINHLKQTAQEKQQVLFNRLEVIYLIFSLLIILLSVFASMAVSKGITDPFKTLSSYLKKLIASDFRKKERIIVKSNSLEVEELYQEFNHMITQLLEREKDRNKAEKTLRDSELKLRELMELLPIIVYEADEQDTILYANQTFYATFGYSKSDIKNGVNLIHLVDPDDREKLLFTESIIKNEVIATHKNGDKFPALIYANQVVKDNAIVGSRGVIIDVSDRLLALKKLNKKTKEKLEQKKK